MRTGILVPIVIACWAASALAQQGASIPPAAPDLSGMQAQINALQSAIPAPDNSAPPPELVGGAAGATSTYRRGDAVQPRITRSKTIVLAADGTGTFDWVALGQAAMAQVPAVSLAPVYTAALGVPTCWPTAASVSAISVKCVVQTTTAVTIVGIGASLTTTAPAAGLSVGVIAIPPS